MKTLITTCIVLYASISIAIAQKNNSNQLYEISYIQPKANYIAEFEQAVKEHYKLFHETNDGYAASLREVTEGELQGWYVWMLGPCGEASVHKHKSDGAHDENWDLFVNPLIEKYGDVSMWKYDPEFSKGNEEIPEGITYNVMAVDLKKGKEAEFKNIMKKVQETEESEKTENVLAASNAMYWNVYKYGYDYDVKIIRPAEGADINSEDFKNDYEAVHGAGSYDQFIKEWNKIVMAYDTDLMTNIK